MSSESPNVVVPAATSPTEIGSEHAALLAEMAQKYIWWLTPAEATAFPARVLAQVMNLGELEDTRRVAAAWGTDRLRSVVRRAEAGQFNARSWHYWHYRLGLAEAGRVPPLPVRRFDS